MKEKFLEILGGIEPKDWEYFNGEKAEKCEALTKEMMKGFAEYVGNRYFLTVEWKWCIINDPTFIHLTTDQLIDEYLKQMK